MAQQNLSAVLKKYPMIYRVIRLTPYVLLTLAGTALLALVALQCLGVSIDSLGTSGDFFGGFMNPAITSASFAILICALIVQIGELGEATKSRTELKAATERQTEQDRELQAVLNATEIAKAIQLEDAAVLRSTATHHEFEGMSLHQALNKQDERVFGLTIDQRDMDAASVRIAAEAGKVVAGGWSLPKSELRSSTPSPESNALAQKLADQTFRLVSLQRGQTAIAQMAALHKHSFIDLAAFSLAQPVFSQTLVRLVQNDKIPDFFSQAEREMIEGLSSISAESK